MKKTPLAHRVSADGGDKSLAPLLNEHICRGTPQLDLKGYVGLTMLVTKAAPAGLLNPLQESRKELRGGLDWL